MIKAPTAAQERIFKVLPQFKTYLENLPPCPKGRPDWSRYTVVKKYMSQYIGWEARRENLLNLSDEDEDFITGSVAYQAGIAAITDRLNV